MADRKLRIDTLTEAMGRAGLNPAGLAKALDVSREAVSNWLQGESQPRPDKVLKLSALLRVRYDELLAAREEALEPVVAFRMRRNRRVTEAHIQHARAMGRLLKPLVPHVPFETVLAPRPLRQPQFDYDYLQSAAAELRPELGVGPTEPIDYLRFIRTFQARQVMLIPVMWGDRTGHENALHIHLPESQTTWIYLNLDTSIVDFKFWMAHELGHVLTPALRGDEAEDFADAFAATLLFPRTLAEPAYAELINLPKKAAQMAVVRALGIDHQISPVTVYRQVNSFAERVGAPKLELDDGIYGLDVNLKKAVSSVRATLFPGGAPEPAAFLHMAEQVFATTFFVALKRYLVESKKPAGFVKELLDVPLVDAKAIHAALA